MSTCLDNLHRLSKYKYLRVSDALFTQVVNIVSEIENILEEHDKEIKDLEKGEGKDYDEVIQELQNSVTILGTSLTDLSSTVTEQGASIDTNTRSISAINSSLSNINSSLNTLSSSVSGLRTDVDALKEKDFIEDAPSDGYYYSRRNGAWVVMPVYTIPGESGAWIKCSNGKYIDPEDYVPAMDVTPIGIAIKGTFTDGSGTYNYAMTVSLVYMDIRNPDTGSTSPESPYWGNNTATTFTDLYLYPDYRGNSGASTDFPSDAEGEEYKGGRYKTNKMIELSTAQPNWKTDAVIVNSVDAGYYPAACCAWRFHTAGTKQGDWWFPSAGEMSAVYYALDGLNKCASKLGSNIPHIPFVYYGGDGYLRTATESTVKNEVIRSMATQSSGFNFISEAKTAMRYVLAITDF